MFASASNTKISKSSGTSIPTFSPWYEPTNDDVILGENISSVTVILDALTSFWKVTSPKNVEPLSIDLTTNPSSGVTDAVTEPLSILLWSNPSIASAGILNNPSPLPLKNPLPDGISILPIKVEPLVGENTLNPSILSTDALIPPLMIRFNSKSSNASAGILNNPPPSPVNNVPLIGLFTIKPAVGSTLASAAPDTILSNSKSSSASNGILNNPPPSPLYKDAVID